MIPVLWELLDYSLKPLALPIVWGFQNAPRVNKPYCLVTYTSIRMPDHSMYDKVNEFGIRINSSWRRAIVTLQFYCGHDSYENASRAASLLATNGSIDKQWLLDVSIGHRMMLEHVPALLNESQYEDRAIYQFEFYYTMNVEDDVGLIETVIVEGNYTGALTNLSCKEVISIADPGFVDPRKE